MLAIRVGLTIHMYGPIVRMRDKAVVDDTENTVSLVTLAPLQIKLAIYLDNRYLSSSDLNFVNVVTADLLAFLENASLQKVFVFPAVDSYHRLLIHKTVEDIDELRSFSLGEGAARRTVVCLQQMSSDRDIDNTECMSSSPSGRGRGRGHALRDSARGYTESCRAESPLVRNENEKVTARSCLSSDIGQGQEIITEAGSDTHTVRSRVRKPEVQRYIPRGRRQQDVNAAPSMQAEAPMCPQSPSSRGRGRRIRTEKEIYVPRARRGQSDRAMETGLTDPSLNSNPVVPECRKSCKLAENTKERQECLIEVESSIINELHDNDLSNRLDNTIKILHDVIVPPSSNLRLTSDPSNIIIHNVCDSSDVIHNVAPESDIEHSRVKKHKKDHKKEKAKGKVKKKSASKEVDEMPVHKTSFPSRHVVSDDMISDVQDGTSRIFEELSDGASSGQKVNVIKGDQDHREPCAAFEERKPSQYLKTGLELNWNKCDTARTDINSDVNTISIIDKSDKNAIENLEVVDRDVKTDFIVDNQAIELTHTLLDISQMEGQTMSAMNPSTKTDMETEHQRQEMYVEKTNLVLTTVESEQSLCERDEFECRMKSIKYASESEECINSDIFLNKDFDVHSIMKPQVYMQQSDGNTNTDNCKDILDDTQTCIISNILETMKQDRNSLMSKTAGEVVCVNRHSEVIPDSVSEDQKVITNVADVHVDPQSEVIPDSVSEDQKVMTNVADVHVDPHSEGIPDSMSEDQKVMANVADVRVDPHSEGIPDSMSEDQKVMANVADVHVDPHSEGIPDSMSEDQKVMANVADVRVDPHSEGIPDSMSEDQKVMANVADVHVDPHSEGIPDAVSEDQKVMTNVADVRVDPHSEGIPDSTSEDQKVMTNVADVMEMEVQPDADESEVRADDESDQSELQLDEESKSRPDEERELLDDDDDEDEESWDKLFDDNGDCIDPKFMEELTATVGNVQIEEPSVINYLAFQPKERDIDYEAYGHVIEIYDFPKEFITRDLIMAFQDFMSRGFDVKWVDDTHALGIFSSAIAAQDALRIVHPLLKIRCLSEATRQSKVKARKNAEFIQPFKARPKTSAVAARRLVAGVLGLAPRISKEKREEERNQLKEAKAKRRLDKKQKVDIWEGSFGKCAMDEES